MRRAARASAAAAFVCALVGLPRLARATGVMEFPDNGSEQEGRGGAWVARASDPLATFYNPAGLAGQPTRLTLQGNLSRQGTCFTRTKAAGDPTQDGVQAGGAYPQVCNDGKVFPNPQLAFTYRLTDRIGLGIAILGPSAVGNVAWPDFGSGGAPSPQRDLLVSSSVLLLTPTIGVGWEPIDNLRIGASFIAGTAPSIDFVTVSPALGDASEQNPGSNDVRAELKAKDWFVPGFTVGAIWTPTDRLDVAAWYKYMAPIDTKGDVVTQSNYYQYGYSNPASSKIVYGDTALANCNNPMLSSTNPCGNGNNASIKVPLPMEGKLGLRYHHPRADVPAEAHVRDPIKQDLFDVEADLTWANDSAFDYLQIRFPGSAGGQGVIPANPGITASAVLPPTADVRHHFSDVFGLRVGGDYNLLPDQLALRAGGFFETQAADPTFQNIDFDAASRFGLALGGTYRLRFGAEKRQALDLMLAYGHVFFSTLSNTDPNAQGIPALTGEQCLGGVKTTAGGQCANGAPQYRTPWPVNLGTITSAIDVLNVGASYAF